MSSKRALRRKACTGKERFTSAEAANRRMRQLVRERGDQGWLTAYRCKFCGGFHYGHPPRRVRQAIEARRGA